METRPESGVSADVLVRVWGMSADGRPFFQNVRASNVTQQGALLSGIECSLKPGDIIGIQHGDRKARFQVVWVVDAGSLRKTEAGVHILDGQQIPWPDLPKAEKAV